MWTCMCVLKRTHCWYAVEINGWGAGLDGALGLGREEGALGDPVYIIFRPFYSTFPTVLRVLPESLVVLIPLPSLPQFLSP